MKITASVLPLFLLIAAEAEDMTWMLQQAGMSRLANYSIHFEQCHSLQTYDERLVENGANTVLGTQRFVTFRLCPTSTTECARGQCQDSYGEYTVDLETYLEMTAAHYLEQQQEVCRSCEKNCDNNVGDKRGEFLDEEEEEEIHDNGASLSQNEFDCDTCSAECEKIEMMVEYGYIDASNFLECQMIYDSVYDDDARGYSSYYAGPICANNGNKVKIGVFTDENCMFLDTSKDVDDYLVDGNGYQMKLSYALLKQTYSSDVCIECKTDNDDSNNNAVASVCQGLYESAAKCEGPHGMEDGMHSSPKAFYNQIEQEAVVCDFIDSINARTHQEKAQQQQSIAQQKSQGGTHRHLMDSGFDSPSWMLDYSVHFEGCQHFTQWNWEANDMEDVRLSTKRLAHYQLCLSNDGSCGSAGQEDCGHYTVDLNEFVESYFQAQIHSKGFSCDYLQESVCQFCQDDALCWESCYRIHGMEGICSQERSPPVDDDDNNNEDDNNYMATLVQLGFFGCREIPVSFRGSPLFVGPYCAAWSTQIRLRLFTDDTCTMFLPSEDYPEFLPIMNRTKTIYANHSLVQEGCLSCTARLDDDATQQDESQQQSMAQQRQRDPPRHRSMEEDYYYNNGPSSNVCESLYPWSGKCESGMDKDGSNNNNACGYIQIVKGSNLMGTNEEEERESFILPESLTSLASAATYQRWSMTVLVAVGLLICLFN